MHSRTKTIILGWACVMLSVAGSAGADTVVIDLVRVGEPADGFGPGYQGISW